MKMKKSICLAAVAGVAILTAMTGCGGSSDKATGGNGEQVTLRFSWWGNDDRHQATLKMIENFEENNPDIKVKGEYTGFGNLEEKITTQLSGGTEADVITVGYDWISKFSADGKGFYDLSKINEIDTATYDKEFLKFGESKGIQNAIPYGKNVMSLLINKSVFDDLGLEVPTTWEEYKEAAKKFPEGAYPITAPTPRFTATIYLQQKTGLPEFDEKGELNYSEKDYLEAMTWYKEMVDAKVFCSRQDYLENVGTEPVSLAQNKKFIEGQYASVSEWTAAVASYETVLKEKNQELVVAPYPEIKGAKGTNLLAKPSMLIAVKKDEKNPEAAGKFVNDFLNGKEANQILGVTRGVPASSAAVEALEEDGVLSGVVKEAYEFGENATTMNITPFFENGTLTAIYQQQMENVELGKASLKEAAKELYSKTKDEAAKLAVSYKISE